MDVIAAIATGSGVSGVGIIRVSGSGCFDLCGRVFQAANALPFPCLLYTSPSPRDP